jgi:signal transduction histidine kinase
MLPGDDVEPKRKPMPEEVERAARRSSAVVVKRKPSFTAFLGMAPMLDNLTESMGGGFRVSVGGRELFKSRAYIQLKASEMPLSRRSIPIEFDECDGSMEVVTVDNDPEKLLKMAELAMKGDIASGVAHDVNNLLCALMGNMEFLAPAIRQKAPEMKSTVADMQVALESICSVLGRMRGLIYSKKDLVTASVREVIDSAFLLIKKQLQTEWSMKGKEISVVNAVPKSLMAEMVYGDTQLAIVNIILNAVEHGIEKTGKIEIRGYRDESNVIIEIENDGRPVPDSIRGELLQRPVTRDCNNGYGLYASAQNIRAIGGDMTFESDSDSTAFTIILPVSCTCGLPGQ